MSSIRGVNVGGNLFDVTDSSNVAPYEPLDFASRGYAKDRCMVKKDGLLYRATVDIESGDPLVINGNIKRTTLDEIISVIETDSDLIAPTEDGATSSADYDIGEQIVRSGILYEVIDDITEGDAFAMDSNVKVAGTLTEQIKALKNRTKALEDETDDIVNVLGAKNIFKYPYPSAFLAGDGRSNFEIANDGTIHTTSADATGVNDTITLIRIVGTGATAKAIAYSEELASILKLNPYVISGGSEETKLIVDYYEDDTWISKVENDGSGDTPLNLPSNCNRIAIYYITPGSVAPITQTLKPMIRLASITDDLFVPYSMTNREMTPYVQAISNPNLLDNPWFTVNQRGESSYSGASAYALDRWKRSSDRTIVTVNTNDITVASSETATNNSYFIQYIDDEIAKYLIGKNITISILYSDGTIKKASGLVANHYGDSSNTIMITAETYQNSWIYLYFDATVQHYGLSINTEYPNKSTNIKAVKLELGSVSTLAMDTAPNYQQELAKCQRYYVRYKYPNAGSSYVNIAMAMMFGTNMNVPINFPTSMRTAPTVNVSNISSFRAQLSSGGNVATAIAMGTYDKDVNHGTLHVTLTNSMENGRMGIFQATSNNAWIDFSADL